MKEYSRAKKIDQYQSRIISGELDLTTLRKKLQEDEVEEEEIAVIVKYMSHQLIRIEEKNATRIKGKNLIQGGALMSISSLLLTIATYLGWFDMGDYYLIAYGPFFGGLLMVFKGRNMMNN